MSSFKPLQIICTAITLACLCDAKVYTQCEFAQALYNRGITDHSNLATWTCIAYYESRFNTEAHNTDTGDYGILQISHLYWCSDTDTPGKDCGITCASLLTDDINEDITCTQHIYAVTEQQQGNGFTAWTTYPAYCTGDQSNWISGCGF